MRRYARPLDPKWAVRFTLAVPLGLPLTYLAHEYLLTPWRVALAWYGLAAYLTVALSWSFLEWPSRNAAIRGNNFFIITAFILVGIAAFTTQSGEPFPRWALITGVLAAVAGYSVAGIFGVRNFLRWLRGHYDEPIVEDRDAERPPPRLV